ncbi:MAG TPA: hypothetical protein V6C69_01450 [Trichormus sp.]|jgi:hypothetical protein
MHEATYFIEKADQLSRLAKQVRAGSIPQNEIYNELETLANEFMAKAVDLDTKRDKAAKAR